MVKIGLKGVEVEVRMSIVAKVQIWRARTTPLLKLQRGGLFRSLFEL